MQISCASATERQNVNYVPSSSQTSAVSAIAALGSARSRGSLKLHLMPGCCLRRCQPAVKCVCLRDVAWKTSIGVSSLDGCGTTRWRG